MIIRVCLNLLVQQQVLGKKDIFKLLLFFLNISIYDSWGGNVSFSK